MVEITLPIVLQILQTAGILVGIVYYITIMRNAQKTRDLTLQAQEQSLKAQEQALETRQAQLFMDLYETYRSYDFRKFGYDIMFVYTWDNWDDYWDKYGPVNNPTAFNSVNSVSAFYEGVGVLVKRGLIDIALVEGLMHLHLKLVWEKLGPIIIESRKVTDIETPAGPRLYTNFEYLYNELMKYLEEHPELNV